MANKVAHSLLAGADGLVPRTLLAVWVVGSDAGAGDADTADGGTGVREVVLGIGGGLLVLCLGLVDVVAGE